MNDNEYQKELEIRYMNTTDGVLDTLPLFCRDYFLSIENSKRPKTRMSYAFDIRLFFRFLQQSEIPHHVENIKEFTIEDLNKVTAKDIELYRHFLQCYTIDGKTYTNSNPGILRKLSSLRSFFGYYYKHEDISANPVAKVERPAVREHEIIRLDAAEVAMLLDEIDKDVDDTSRMQSLYHQKTRIRDLAIVTLLLGTGIRVSECVGLDIGHVDFVNDRITVVRKGGASTYVYFGEEVHKALSDYMEERKKIIPRDGHENALFLSIQKRRICVQAVEDLVKKYASRITTSHITPHKLRSTYGTSLYRESGDIYLVADVLGHKDVNTTKAHYSAMDEDRKRSARNIVKLREV